jgi:flagellum-specific peptidoglycan hydrolase FlgJ
MRRKYQVGGIVYSLFTPKEKIDKIDLTPVISMAHDPIMMDTVVLDGYRPQYSIRGSGSKTEEPEAITTVTVTDEPKTIGIKPITFEQPIAFSSLQPSALRSTPTETSVSTPKSSRAIGQFHTSLYDAFIRAGVNENVARFMVAQDSLETGDGKYHAGTYNYGNIIAGSSWTGSTTIGGDKDGKGRKIKQRFRNYNSVDHYALDKKSLLSSSRYACAMNASTIEEYARCVKAGGYAEDPKYEQKLIKKYYSLYG